MKILTNVNNQNISFFAHFLGKFDFLFFTFLLHILIKTSYLLGILVFGIDKK